MSRLDAARERIDKQLSNWRQGDCTVGEDWFLFRTDADRPLTTAGQMAATKGADNAETAVHGFAVVTQTCDLARRCEARPFVEVCPLVDVDETVVREVKRGRRPNDRYIPGVASHRLVANLDRVMPVEKAVVARWHRTEGCGTDDKARRLSTALARKRATMEFPGDFEELASPLRARADIRPIY